MYQHHDEPKIENLRDLIRVSKKRENLLAKKVRLKEGRRKGNPPVSQGLLVLQPFNVGSELVRVLHRKRLLLVNHLGFLNVFPVIIGMSGFCIS